MGHRPRQDHCAVATDLNRGDGNTHVSFRRFPMVANQYYLHWIFPLFGFLGTATCKANPEFINKLKTAHPKTD
jgi:hypothetical protein